MSQNEQLQRSNQEEQDAAALRELVEEAGGFDKIPEDDMDVLRTWREEIRDRGADKEVGRIALGEDPAVRPFRKVRTSDSRGVMTTEWDKKMDGDGAGAKSKDDSARGW